MQALVTALRRFLIIVIIMASAWVILANYSFVFSKKIRGEVLEVERMNQPNAIIGGSALTAEQMFSFALMIKDFDGKIYSSSSEDRQWAIAKKGYCVEARFFPYPPWNFEKDGTFFNARLLSVFDCKAAPPGWTPGLASSARVEASPTPGQEATPAASPSIPSSPTPSPTSKK